MTPTPLEECSKNARDAASATAQHACVAQQGVITDQPGAVQEVIIAQPSAVQDDLTAQPSDVQDDSHGVVKLHVSHHMGDVARIRGRVGHSPSSIKTESPDDVKELIDTIVAAQKSVGVWA